MSNGKGGGGLKSRPLVNADAFKLTNRGSEAFFRCQVSGVRCQVSGFRCQVSGFRFQVSGIKGQNK
jgi:hypothetical protein